MLQIQHFCKTGQIQRGVLAKIRLNFSQEKKEFFNWFLVFLGLGADYKEKQTQQNKFYMKRQNN